MISRRVVALVGLLVWLLAGLELVQAVAIDTAPLVVVAAIGAVCLVASWHAWLRTGHRWLLPVFCLASVASTAGEGSGVGVLLLLLGVGMVTLGCGIAAGAAASVVLTVAGTVVNRLLEHRRFGWGLVGEMAATLVVFGLGVLLGQLLREVQAERRRNAELVDEVRRSALTEQELMLADERARSARELHDGLGHQLTLVVLSLEYAERMRARDVDKAFAEVEQAHQTAAGALAHMRRWVRALNPPREQALQGNGAFAAIADSFGGTGLEVSFTHDGPERELDRASSLFALRMVQEGLTNVVRHSGAAHVALHVSWQPRSLGLRLADDGGAGARLEPGFGLRSLTERARELGGAFEAHPTGTGVELVAHVPVAPAVAEVLR